MAGARKYVAIVDDEESVRRALKRLLRASGFEVETFASGSELIKALPTNAPSCLILDIHMPRMSGFEIQAELEARKLEIPVIFVTAFEDPEDERRARSAGAVGLLRKPIKGEALLAAISSAVGWGGASSSVDDIVR
jgi:FixJ family two-component response regulator